MKKIISAVLTVSMLLGATTVAYALPKDKASKPVSTSVAIELDAMTRTPKKVEVKKIEVKKPETTEKVKKVDVKKDAKLDKSRESLIKKCDGVITQINKLKDYIISKEGKLLVDLDLATGDVAIKSIESAIGKVNDFKRRIDDATTSQELKTISKELQNNWMKNQTFVKRITGLTSAARLKTAYDETKLLVAKLGEAMNVTTTDSSITLDVEPYTEEYEQIKADLEEAYADYLEADALYSSITDSAKGDKNFKIAHAKLMEAKDELHDVLIDTKHLLVEIKTGVRKQLDVNKVDDDDEDDDDDEVDDDDDDEVDDDDDEVDDD